MTRPHPTDGPSEATLEPVDFDPFAEVALDVPFALSEAQREIWAVVQMGPEASCAYNQCFVLSLRGAVSVDAMKRAVQLVFDRHESLRTRFDGWGRSQAVLPSQPIALPVLDLSSLATEERRTGLQSVLAEEVRTPLDLINGTGARARLVVEASDRVHLVITAHHIVFDGWSSLLFFQELSVFYKAARGGTTAELPPATPFRRQLEIEQSPAGLQRAEVDLSYWRARFADGAPSLDLPTDHVRPPITTYGGARADLLLTRVPSADVARVASRLGATSVGLLLAAFQALLYRLTGQNDFVVGIPVSARVPNEGGTLMGHATNLLPIRVRIDGNASFADLVREARTALLDCHDHQSLTFGTLVRDMNLPRNTSRTPLVAALFNVGTRGAPSFPDSQAEVTAAPRCFVNFEIEMQIVDTRRELILELAYNTDLFTADTAGRWLGLYEELLAGALATLDTPLDQLPLLRDADRKTLVEWNRTARNYPSLLTLHELLARQAERTPERIAIRSGEQQVSYAELEARSNQLAHALRRRGLGRGTLVGLCLERSVDMVAAVLAVLKAGAGYVPLDPAFPADRLAFMIEDSGLALVVSESELALCHGCAAERTLALDTARNELAQESKTRLASDEQAARAEDVAYVLYTSGSTGRPKGVRVPHRAAVNFLTSMQREPGLGPDDRLLAVTTLSFDIALLELMLPLSVGAQVILASHEDALDGTALQQLLERGQVTVMQATPATWRLLIDSGWQGRPGFKALCGGEALPVDLAESLLARVGELWNMYGPTETTVWSTCWRVTEPRQGISIGHPIANTSIWILDPQRQICPIGVPGEIFIGGDGVALGYLNRPELTSERFIPDPHSSVPGARMYKTGDLGRWRANGLLECLGRTDLQVKVRGFRIELGEIEAVLMDESSVRQAAVTVHTDALGEARIVAYVVYEPGETRTGSEMRRRLANKLPDYMLPHIFVELERLPLTANGKVDRRALLPPFAHEAQAAEEHIEPRTEAERAIAALWCELLKVERVSVRDNFFALGGHSLLSAQMAAQLFERTGHRLSLRSVIFETLEQLAANCGLPAHPTDPT